MMKKKKSQTARNINLETQIKIKFKNLPIKCKVKAVYKPYSLIQRITTLEEGNSLGLFNDVTVKFIYNDCRT
jgi:hypothetical protein